MERLCYADLRFLIVFFAVSNKALSSHSIRQMPDIVPLFTAVANKDIV